MTVSDLRKILATLPANTDIRIIIGSAEEHATCATRYGTSLLLCDNLTGMTGGETVLFNDHDDLLRATDAQRQIAAREGVVMRAAE